MATASDTLAIIEQGTYLNRHGTTVSVCGDVRTAVDGTRVVRPDEWDLLIDAGARSAGTAAARLEVTGETTLTATHRLVVAEGRSDTAALNFASAKNAGGGFKNGSQAQEESLARASALYASLVAAPTYYSANRAADLQYTDHAILSPSVPVFRDDDGNLLDAPYAVTFITMPAANLGAMAAGSPLRASVPTVMFRRARFVLALAAESGCRTLVLGAWGCGVFRNDPAVVADAFAYWLADQHPWRRCFDHIVFAIYDGTRDRAIPSLFADRLRLEPVTAVAPDRTATTGVGAAPPVSRPAC